MTRKLTRYNEISIRSSQLNIFFNMSLFGFRISQSRYLLRLSLLQKISPLQVQRLNDLKRKNACSLDLHFFAKIFC